LLCSKLNNTGAKLAGVPPHYVYFVIVIVKPWERLFVIVVDIINAYG
jgi:hypothetical protein